MSSQGSSTKDEGRVEDAADQDASDTARSAESGTEARQGVDPASADASEVDHQCDEPAVDGATENDARGTAAVVAPRVTVEPSGRLTALLVAAAFLTVAVLLLLIARSKAWDPYLCETNDDCRGLTQCIESHCTSAEVWQTEHGGAALPPSTEAQPSSGE